MRVRIGTAVSLIGALLIVVGVVGLLTQEDCGETSAATTTTGETTTTTGAASTTTPGEATTTTTTAVPVETVEDFFVDYVQAIESGDVDFLFARLHPVVLDQPSADTCRGFIEREVLALEDYRTTGPAVGPEAQTVAESWA